MSPEEVGQLRAALAAAEARIHELDAQLASERQAADVRRGHLLGLEARAARLEEAARSAALILSTPGGAAGAAVAVLRGALGGGPEP